MKHLIGLLIFVIGFSARAGIMAEPFVGYSMGTLNATVSSVDVTSKASGVGYGARLGYRFPMGLSLAGEYLGGSGTIKYDTAGTTDDTYSETAMGLVVGYDHGMFRVWAGYGVSDELTDKQTTGDVVFKGTNFKVGVGVMPVQHLSINFEYLIPKYTKFTTGGVESDISTIYSKFDTSTMFLSVSAPFEFGGK